MVDLLLLHPQLGAGLGLCGILAHRLGAAHVVLTDGDTDTLDNMRNNVSSNCPSSDSSISCSQLVWGRRIDDFVNRHGQFDVILGSDIIYVPEILEPLFLQTVPMLLQEDGHFLLAYARRNVSIDLVLEVASRAGFSWTHDDVSESVYVFQKKRME
jgi:predicted nicotinamide N-methyase